MATDVELAFGQAGEDGEGCDSWWCLTPWPALRIEASPRFPLSLTGEGGPKASTSSGARSMPDEAERCYLKTTLVPGGKLCRRRFLPSAGLISIAPASSSGISALSRSWVV